MAERYSGSRPDMKYFERQKLTYVDYKCSPTVGTIRQLLYYYDAFILGSITIAYMTIHDIVFSINIAGGDVVVQSVGLLRLAPPTRPCDERPPVMYGHFCLVPRVSVHDRYYCTADEDCLLLRGIANTF